jgi:malate dehydrogenase (oxaloacetate-decarboxylating)(NADP+)
MFYAFLIFSEGRWMCGPRKYNQVNNVLCFPYIFRGALDVRATEINEEMKIAAVKAIAELAKQVITEDIKEVYSLGNTQFGKTYILPKPTDSRLKTSVSAAVAKAAIKSGVAKGKIEDWEEYTQQLKGKITSKDLSVCL